jgi:hypothetical protein
MQHCTERGKKSKKKSGFGAVQLEAYSISFVNDDRKEMRRGKTHSKNDNQQTFLATDKILQIIWFNHVL